MRGEGEEVNRQGHGSDFLSHFEDNKNRANGIIDDTVQLHTPPLPPSRPE